ncbi:DUF4331 domain-containing protein [Leucothrix sargassi]|nr:DUF4331 domain-containing protein [Leucothrix sargassi]
MKIITTLSMASLALAIAGTSQASSHREAPFVAELPKADATDFYAFRSYEPGREDYVTLIANYNPLQDPYGGPNYFSLSSDTLYEIHIDNNGDAVEDLTFQFQFTEKLGGEHDAGITLNVGGKDVAVPLKNVGGVTAADSSALNYHEAYTLTTVAGDRRTGTKYTASNASDGTSTFAKPYDNVGEKTFGTAYADYANSFIHSVKLEGCPAGSDIGKVFVGQRKDSFAVNLGEIFDLVNTNPLGGVNDEADDLADKNVTTLALEVPISCLTGDNENGIIGAWTTASMQQVRVLDPSPKSLMTQVNSGAWTQVSRLGMPLVNEVVIGLPDKNLFNASEPKDDAQFLEYVTNPTLPALVEALYPSAPAPTNFPRNDLVAAFLTGLEGINKDGSVGEMIRLNTGIAVTPKATQSNFGVAGGDAAGFPNGRRPGDDVVDAELRVAMGLLCHLGLDLCEPEDAPAGLAAITDGVEQRPDQFDNVFPYVTTPISGSPN